LCAVQLGATTSILKHVLKRPTADPAQVRAIHPSRLRQLLIVFAVRDEAARFRAELVHVDEPQMNDMQLAPR